MKTDTLKVGISDPKFHVVVNMKVAENDTDVRVLSVDNEEYRVQCFMRGHRINLQEGEAREIVRGQIDGKPSTLLADPEQIKDTVTKRQAVDLQSKVTRDVQNAVDSFDPTAEKKRGGRPAKTVELSQEKVASLLADPAALQAYMQSMGLKVELK